MIHSFCVGHKQSQHSLHLPCLHEADSQGVQVFTQPSSSPTFLDRCLLWTSLCFPQNLHHHQSVYVLPLGWEAKFNTQTKQWVLLKFCKFSNTCKRKCGTSGSHDNEYGKGCVLGCCTKESGRCRQTFERNLLHPLPGWWVPSEMPVSTRLHSAPSPEESQPPSKLLWFST
jgi:hypothetical protein